VEGLEQPGDFNGYVHLLDWGHVRVDFRCPIGELDRLGQAQLHQPFAPGCGATVRFLQCGHTPWTTVRHIDLYHQILLGALLHLHIDQHHLPAIQRIFRPFQSVQKPISECFNL